MKFTDIKLILPGLPPVSCFVFYLGSSAIVSQRIYNEFLSNYYKYKRPEFFKDDLELLVLPQSFISLEQIISTFLEETWLAKFKINTFLLLFVGLIVVHFGWLAWAYYVLYSHVGGSTVVLVVSMLLSALFYVKGWIVWFLQDKI